MRDDRKNLISGQASQTLNSLLSCLSGEEAILLDQMKEEILANISQFTKMTDYLQPIKKVENIFFKKNFHYSQADQIILKQALVAKLALNLPDLVAKMDLPASILELYPAAIERVADYLKSSSDDTYDLTSDFFRKDIRFVLGLSVPCGVQVVDMKSRLRLRTVVLSFLRSKDISASKRYFLTKGYRTWLQIHTESRYLTDYNEQGWDRCYLRIAELLKRKKDITGMMGTSWFYDPQLLKISPRVAYLQQRPLERGAFLLRHGTQSSDIANAIKTSETRRRLYEEGKYIPVCYSILWPRKELIAWAEQAKRSISSAQL